jgi:hypothetical protein
MRDTEKYIYVELALPKDNRAVQALIKESEDMAIPLRVLAKKATIEAYMPTDDDEEEEEVRPRKPKRKTGKKKTESSASSVSFDTADAFLDDGF